MGRLMRSCVQSMLKFVNSFIGMVGVAMILYSVWLVRTWQRNTGDWPFPSSDHPGPWFIWAFLGLGVTLCVITCSGHVAAETANGCCLYMYMMFVFVLLMLEAGITVDVFLNPDWEKDFPEDPSGNFDHFKKFISKNFHMCKWVGLSIVSIQGLSFILSMILKALGPHRYYDSDDDYYSSDAAPLLNNGVHPPPYVGDPIYGSRKDAWTIRINDKTNR